MNGAVLVFVAIAYGLSIALSLVVGLTGGYQSRLVFGFGVASMFVPAVAMLIVESTMQEKVWSFGWCRFPLKYLPVALLLMPVVMHAVMLPVAATLWGRLPWEDWLTPEADGLYHTPASRGWGVLTTQGLVGARSGRRSAALSAARERGISRSEFIRQHLAPVLEQYRRHPKPRSARIVHALAERGNERELFGGGS